MSKKSQIKICGLHREMDIIMVNEVMPEYVGFVINYPKSHRSINDIELIKLKNKLKSEIKAVGVFVDANMYDIMQLADNLDIIQLHGEEDNNFVNTLRKMLPGKEIWKAFKITKEEDLELAMKSRADLVVLDNGCGTGETFDWDIIGDFSKRFALAGGIDIDNVAMAMNRFEPYIIDVSSSLEVDQVKDFDKIKEMVKVIRNE